MINETQRHRSLHHLPLRHRPLQTTLAKLVLAIAFCWLLTPTVTRGAADEDLKVDAMEMSTVSFSKPIRRADAAGTVQAYTQAIRILLKGQFPAYRAEPFELYIGDHQVREYSGDRKQLQIIVFEPEQLDRFEGGEIRYRQPRGEMRSLELAFSRRGLQRLEPSQPSD